VQDRRLLNPLLVRLLSPRLGYLPARWPETVYLHVRDRALAAGTSESGYLASLLRTEDPAGLAVLIDAATVGHTAAYRHPEQFEQLGSLLTGLAKARSKPVAIWCAGCSTGEEAFSVAHVARSVGVAVTVLATDVNPVAISVARTGRLPARSFVGATVPGDWTQDTLDLLRRRIRFEAVSLTAAQPTLGMGPFDIVFCRNVLIYFEREQVPRLVERLVSELVPGGHLVVAPVEGVLPLPRELTWAPAAGWLQRPHVAEPAPAGQLPSLGSQAESVVPPPVVLRRWRLVAGAPRRVEDRGPQAVGENRRLPTVPPELSAHGSPVEEAARMLSDGRTSDAEQALSELLNDNPEQVAGWFLLGEALLARGERAQARAAFLRAARCVTTTEAEIDADLLRRAAIRRADAL
jgi:chemotaxis protein methyltransferase CheR